MRFFAKINPFSLFVLISAAMTLQSCAFIAGKDDQEIPAGQPLNLRFVESLKNQESLRGESYREVVTASPTAASLQRPGSVYADQFRVYVTDIAMPARVFIFDRTDRTVRALNVPPPSSTAEGKLLAPSGIAVDVSSKIFVSDAQQGRVFGYDRNGKLLMVLGRPQAIASQTTISVLGSPSALATNNANNRIYVVDSAGQQVRVFNTLGIHLFEGRRFRIPGSGRP